MAGTIDQLNFEIILDDKKFKDLVQTDINLAKQLNTDLTAIFNLKAKLDAATSKEAVNAEKVAEATAKRATQEQKLQTEMAKTALQQQKVATETERTRQLQEKNTTAVKATNTALTGTSTILRTITQLTGVYFGAMGVRRLLSSLIEITGQFEVQRMALRSMLQDIDGADKIFEDLYRFSSESTYRFSELAKYAKQLAAFNIEQKSLLETTKMLGDVASGVGVSMDRIILAYGHVKSSGFLRGIQLRSFSQNGVPVLDELAKMFSELENRAVSLGEVFDKMTKREIPFEMVEQAFKNMTSEGGKFYQMQEVLAKTLAGQINILKGRWENMLAAWGQANSGVLKETVSTVSNLIANFEEVGRVIKELVAAYGIYTAALISMEIMTNTFVLANHKLLASLVSIGKWIISNPYAILAAAIAAVAYSAYKSATALNEIDKIQIAATNSVQKFNGAVETEIGELDSLYAKLKFAKEGTEEYNAAKLAIEKRFGPYIQQLRAEGQEVSDLATLYDSLATKIREATKERFRESATQDLTKAYGDATNAINSYFGEVVGSIENGLGRALSAREREALWTKVRGGINADNDNLFVRTTLGLKSGLNTVNTDIQMIGKVYDLAGKTISHAGETNQDILDALGVAWKEASDKYATSMTEAMDAFKAFDESQQTELGGGGGNVYKVSDIIKGIQNLDKEIDKIRDKARNGSITEEEADRLEQLIGDRDTQKKLYEQIMGVKYDKDMRGLASGKSKAEHELNEERARIKANISVLEKYKSAYEKLEPYFGDGTNSQLARIFGGNASDYANLDEQIGKLVENLRSLGKEGNEAADAIEARLGTDAVSQIIKSQKEVEKQQKAIEKYETTLRKWMGEDFNLGGSGFEFDINKVYSDFNSTLGKIQEKYIEAVKQAEAAHKGDTEAIEREKQALAGLRDAEIEYERAKSQDRMDKLAESYLKDQYFMRGISLDNLSRLSLKQLSNLKKELNDISREALQMRNQFSGVEGFVGSLGMKLGELTEEDFAELKKVLPEAEMEMVSFADSVKKTGLSFDKLVDKIQAAIKKGLDNLSEEEKKSIARAAKYAASEVLELAKAFGELGEAMDDARMTEAANSMQELGSFAADVAKGYSQGGVYGAILGGVISIGTQILGDMAEGARKEAELAESIREAALAYEDALDDTALGRQSGIFGTNTLGKLQAYLAILNKYGTIISDFHREMSESFGTTYTRDYVDENGNFLMDKLKADLDAGLFSGPVVDEVRHAIEKYKEALEEVDSIIESVFSNIASSAADKIVDSWVEAGNAALDYTDILDDVARAYSKMLIQSMIMETALDPITDDLKAAFTSGRYGDAMAMVANAMQAIQDAAPMYEEILSAFDPYFAHGDSGSNSLGSGIKSITEDTANLLASYINAIRADVSVMRGLQESGWESVSTAIPTMNDYLNRVAANTFDTAQNTQRILSELQSVIGAPGTSGMVVRVERM